MFIEAPKPMPVTHLQDGFAQREPQDHPPVRPSSRLDLIRMFEENEILAQIKALRQEVGSRLDDMDLRLRKIEADLTAPRQPETHEFDSRLEEMDLRLRRIETLNQPRLVDSAPIEPTPAPAPVPVPEAQYVPPVPPPPTTAVKMTINPLGDVSRVRVVEGALLAIDGVEAVSLQTLSGDTAELQAMVQENVSLIGGLRRTLPLAFDVTQSDDTTFAITLAEPLAGPVQDDVVVHKAP